MGVFQQPVSQFLKALLPAVVLAKLGPFQPPDVTQNPDVEPRAIEPDDLVADFVKVIH